MDIIEMGSGDCSKISILFDVIPENKISGIEYMPVDVSEAAIVKSAGKLQSRYPDLKIHGLLADFMKHLTLPDDRKKLICFFGSTLGNLTRTEANTFLLDLKNLMNPGDTLLLGLDMVKDIQVLLDAYNDSEGITALFNKNVLNVINGIVGTDFDSNNFEHVSSYNKQKNRMEMYLKATKDQIIHSEVFKEKIIIKEGESIHTENSHKYTFEDIKDFSTISGLNIDEIYTDDNEWFSIVKFIRK
jgi:L-histidine N-alpha-methyltransferase